MTIRAELLREQGNQLADEGYSWGAIYMRMMQQNDTFAVKLPKAFLKELADDVTKPAGNMPNCDRLLYEVALNAWRDGMCRSQIVPALWSRASTLFVSNGTRVFMTMQECGEIADEARADYVAEQAGAAHAGAGELQYEDVQDAVDGFCMQYGVTLVYKDGEWWCYKGTELISHETDWFNLFHNVAGELS